MYPVEMKVRIAAFLADWNDSVKGQSAQRKQANVHCSSRREFKAVFDAQGAKNGAGAVGAEAEFCDSKRICGQLR